MNDPVSGAPDEGALEGHAGTTPPRARRAVGSVALVAVLSVLLFVFVEGGASATLSLYTLLVRPPEQMREERAHTEYDKDLGWIHKPDLFIENLYGPGVYFRTNAQRFRANRVYATEVPTGRKRAICSGDSFTLGHSVDNDHTWCALLTRLDPDLETVNMGQAAYGVDQAYLWYRRDGVELEHDLHLFAFITTDFARMRQDDFLGYPKPYLRIQDGRLEVQNVPVPDRSKSIPRYDAALQAARRLRVVELGEKVLGRLGLSIGAPAEAKLSEDQVRDVATLVFRDLQRLNAEKGSVLVLVFIPRSGDVEFRWSDPWRAFVAQAASELGIIFIDLVPEFRQLGLSKAESLFVDPYHPSHMANSGNEWIAQQLYRKMLEHPELAANLGVSR